MENKVMDIGNIVWLKDDKGVNHLQFDPSQEFISLSYRDQSDLLGRCYLMILHAADLAYDAHAAQLKKEEA